MQTYGQATHLGFLQLVLDGTTGEIQSYEGKLIPVDASRLTPDPLIAAKLEKYRSSHTKILAKAGRTEARMNRRYPGHGSIPLQTNSIVHLSKAVAAIADWRTPIRLNETTSTYFERLASLSPPDAAE